MNELTIPQWIELLDRLLSALEAVAKTGVDETLPESHGTISRADGTAEQIAGTHKIVLLEVWNELKGDCKYWEQRTVDTERKLAEHRERANAGWRNVELFRAAVNRPSPEYTVVDAIVAAKANQAAADECERLTRWIEIFIRIAHEDEDATIDMQTLPSLLDGILAVLNDYREAAARNQAAADTLEQIKQGEQFELEGYICVEMNLWNRISSQCNANRVAADTLKRLRKGEYIEVDGIKRWLSYCASSAVLQAGNERATLAQQLAEQEARENDAEREWTDIVYHLVDAVGRRQGKSISENVEHAVAAIAEFRRAAERWKEVEFEAGRSLHGDNDETAAWVMVLPNTDGAFGEDVDSSIAARKAAEASEPPLLPDRCELQEQPLPNLEATP